MEDERRLVGRMLRHWKDMVHERGLPRLDEVDPWMLGDAWANCILIAVEAPIELSHFIAVGENLGVALCPADTLAEVLLSHLPSVLSERRCLIVEGGATLRGVSILHRSVLLPLSADGVTIDHVLGATNYRPLRTDEGPAMQIV